MTNIDMKNLFAWGQKILCKTHFLIKKMFIIILPNKCDVMGLWGMGPAYFGSILKIMLLLFFYDC